MAPGRRQSPPKRGSPAASSPPSPLPIHQLRRVTVVLALLFPLMLYARTTEFVYVHADDIDLIAGNQTFLRDLGNLARTFERSYFETETDFTGQKTYYRPITILSFMLDARRGNADPRVYHTTNVALHAIVCVLLLALASTWSAPWGGALAASLVFAAHPINVQAVAWIAGRNDLLLAMFGLFSLIAWSRADGSQRSAPWWIALHVVAFALSLFSKESGVVVPALAVLHQRVARLAPVSRTQWVGLAGDLIILLVWTRLRATALAGSPSMAPGEMATLVVVNSPQLLLQLGKLLAPVRLNVSPSVDATGLVLGVVAVVAFGWIGLRRIPRRQALLGACWVLAFLVSTLVVPSLPVYEHRNYLPLAGVLLSLAMWRSIQQTVNRRSESRHVARDRRAIAVGIALVVALFAAQTYARQRVFRDGFAYWTDAARDPGFARFAHVNLGRLHDGAGRYEQARREYLRALEIDPAIPQAHNNLGVVSMKLNEPERAVAHFAEEVRRHPWNADAWFNLGVAAEQQGNLVDARRYYERALRENAHLRPAYEKLRAMPPSVR